MPVRRSSGDSGGYKVSRKVRVAVGNVKGGDDAGSTKSNDGKSHRKVRVSIEESSGGVRSVDDKKKGSKRVKTRGKTDDDAPYVDVNERLSERRGRGKRELKMKSCDEGFEAATNGSIGHKRKRIRADPEIVEDKIFDGNDRKFRPKSTNNVAGSYLDKGKKVPRGKDGEVREESTKISKRESNDKKIQRGRIEGARQLKYNQEDNLGNGKTKVRDNKRVPLATTKEDAKQRKTAVSFVEKSRNRNDQGKKGLNTDSDLAKGPRKLKKQGIRLDPYDTSNKRLDDSISTNGQFRFSSDD